MISIVITTYNRPAFLAETLKSVVKQAFPIEIIVVNDGGLDVSKIIGSYDTPITLINLNKNSGPAAALNRAVEVAHGHYISICDDDDIFSPDHIETLTLHLGRHKECELVYSNVYAFVENPSKIIGKMNTRFQLEKLQETNFIVPSSTVFSKSLYEHVGGFDESLSGYWDWDFFLTASKYTDIQHVDKFLTYYRIHEQSFQKTQEKIERRKMLNRLSKKHNLGPLSVKHLFENFEVI